MKPRDHFNLVVLGTTLLAIGGSDDSSIEMWEGLGEPWKDTSLSLSSSLRQFSASSYSDLECFAGPLPQHSCPTLDGDLCTFPFTKGRLNIVFGNIYCEFQDLKPIHLVSVMMGLGFTVLLKQTLGHNVTLKNVPSWVGGTDMQILTY